MIIQILVIFILPFPVLPTPEISYTEYPYTYVLGDSDFYPLEFPTPKFVQKIRTNDLHHKLKELEKNLYQIEGPVPKPEVYQLLSSAASKLGNAFSSIEDLRKEQLVESKIGEMIEEESTTNSLRLMTAQIVPLTHRIREMLNPVADLSERRLSVIPAIHSCEIISNLFADKSFIAWKYKVIFIPYLIAFSALYSTVAKIGGELLPSKRAHLIEEMSKLSGIILLDYQDGVTEGRLALIRVRKFKIWQVKLICPNPRGIAYDWASFWDQRYPNHFTHSKSGCVYGVQSQLDEFNSIEEGKEERRSIRVILDEVTGRNYCGWSNCYDNLKGIVRKQIDELFEASLNLIPKMQRYQNDGIRAAFCDKSYSNPNHRQGFGCWKGYCWSYCGTIAFALTYDWCYTALNNRYVKCQFDSQCCQDWKCGGPCAII